MAKEKPKFEVVIIAPSFVIGEDHLATKTEHYFSGTNAILINLLTENAVGSLLTVSVSLHDVARLHVLGLKSSVPAGRYMASSGGLQGTNWYDAFVIAAKYFPETSERFTVPTEEKLIVKCSIDAQKTEKAFGITFQTYEEQVKSVLSSYLSLLKSEGKMG
jgi:hypothetical protein